MLFRHGREIKDAGKWAVRVGCWNVFDSKSLPVRKSESMRGSERRGGSWESGGGGDGGGEQIRNIF